MANIKDLRTVFIRGISFNIDEKLLEETFTEIGPVRQCFLVRQKGKVQHQGFGFVVYALQEDAERAVTEMNGKQLAGRKLKVEIANKRAPLEERKKKRLASQPTPDDADAGNEDGYGVPNAELPPPPGIAAPTTALVQTKPKAETNARAKKLSFTTSTATVPANSKQEVVLDRMTKKRKQSDDTPVAATSRSAVTPTAPAINSTGTRAAPAVPLPERALGAVSGSGKEHDGVGSEKHKWARAVALGGLPDIAVPAVLKLAESVGQVQEVIDPASAELVAASKLVADGCTGHVIVVVYSSVKEAMDAVIRLHGRLIPLDEHGARVKKKRKKEKGAAAGPVAQTVTLWARQVSGEGAHTKKWRVIVRNLPFKATEAAVREALAPAGFVWDLRLPRRPDGAPRGFAFASFTCKAHAEAAVAHVNGTQVGGRPVAVDWAVAKSQFDAGKGGEEADVPGTIRAGTSIDGADLGSDHDVAAADDDGDEAGVEVDERERVLMKSVLEQVLEAEEEEGDEPKGLEKRAAKESGLGERKGKVGAAAEELNGKKTKKRRSGEEDAAEVAETKTKAVGLVSESNGVHDEDAEEPKDVKRSDATASKKQKLEKKAEAAEKRIDAGAKGDKVPPGDGDAGIKPWLSRTVFVRGLPLDVASIDLLARLQVFGKVHDCRLVMDKESGKPKGTAFVEFQRGEDAAAAAEACARRRRHEGPGISLGGKPLDVDLAVSGEQARGLAVGARGGAPTDKRNLYLAKEGAILQDSAAWQAMSEGDRKKRERAAAEKQMKLRSPNFVVSPLRLSVRNIPLSFDENALRKLFVEAVKTRATRENPKISEVKILKDPERLDANGKPTSRGIGFVAFTETAHALAALRQLNNNPSTWGKERRPIVEFALEKVQVLKKLEAIQKARSATSSENVDPDAPPKTRREKLLEKVKAKRARRKARKAAEAGEAGAVEKSNNTTAAVGSSVGKSNRTKSDRKKKAGKATGEEVDKKLQSPGAAAGMEGAKGKGGNSLTLPSKQKRVGKSNKSDTGATQEPKEKVATGKGLVQKGVNGVRGAERRVQTEHAQVNKRQRHEEGALDRLAEDAVPSGSMMLQSGKGKKNKQGEVTDKTDKLVAGYMERLFGRGKSENGTKASDGSIGASMKRWFE